MKALSVKPKWANLIASGRKRIESRSWSTKYRGPLLICATQPVGQAICVVNLIDCRPASPDDAEAACDVVESGGFSWILADVAPIKSFAVKGRLGLYDVDISAEVGVEPPLLPWVGSVPPSALPAR